MTTKMTEEQAEAFVYEKLRFLGMTAEVMLGWSEPVRKRWVKAVLNEYKA